MDFLLFESEIILDKKLRELFQPIEEVCYLLRNSIEEYTGDYSHENGRIGDDGGHNNRMSELMKIIYSRKGDAIQTKVDSAVREIEKFVTRPYIWTKRHLILHIYQQIRLCQMWHIKYICLDCMRRDCSRLIFTYFAIKC